MAWPHILATQHKPIVGPFVSLEFLVDLGSHTAYVCLVQPVFRPSRLNLYCIGLTLLQMPFYVMITLDHSLLSATLN